MPLSRSMTAKNNNKTASAILYYKYRPFANFYGAGPEEKKTERVKSKLVVCSEERLPKGSERNSIVKNTLNQSSHEFEC